MEIELKFRIPDETTAARIWENALFSQQEEADSRQDIVMAATYYDTADGDLMRNQIAYRIRREGNRLIATMKWKGKSEDGLHVREELTVPVADPCPDVKVFLESDIGAELAQLLEGKELVPIMTTNILRRMLRIDTGEGLFELSVDSGDVRAAGGADPILEVEVELYSGETEELLDIGRKLQEVYDLQPENTSKYAKGIRLLAEAGALPIAADE